jgi:hypothetical protein
LFDIRTHEVLQSSPLPVLAISNKLLKPAISKTRSNALQSSNGKLDLFMLLVIFAAGLLVRRMTALDISQTRQPRPLKAR